MTQDMTWLRPHFDAVVETWYPLIQAAYRLYPSLVPLDYFTVEAHLKTLLGARNVQLELNDVAYRTYPKDIFLEIIALDKTNQRMAREDYDDCDDRAWEFKHNMRYWFNANAVGFVVDKSAWHAYNIIVFPDHAELLEPQQDRFVTFGEAITVATPKIGTGLYSLTSGIITI